MTFLGTAAALAIVGASVTPSVGASQPAPMAVPAQSAEAMVLRAGAEVPMKTLTELSSKTNRQGNRFELSVTEDVVVEGHVVIPRGSRGVGEIVRLVPKGAFGKSGKMDTVLLYVAVGNHRIQLDGRSGDRGKSGTGATVATAVLAGVASAFVTGTSARVPAGSTMIGYVEKDLPLVVQTAAQQTPIAGLPVK